MFVNMPLLLEYVVEVPDLDAPVDGGGDDLVVGSDHQGLDLHDPLEVSRHPLDEGAVIHVPDQQLLAYSRHGQLVALGEDDVGGGVEPLGDVPHSVRQEESLDLFLGGDISRYIKNQRKARYALMQHYEALDQ